MSKKKVRPTFAQLQLWYLRRISNMEAIELMVHSNAALRRHHAHQRGLSDGLRLLREVLECGYKLDEVVPSDLEIPIDFKWEK